MLPRLRSWSTQPPLWRRLAEPLTVSLHLPHQIPTLGVMRKANRLVGITGRTTTTAASARPISQMQACTMAAEAEEMVAVGTRRGVRNVIWEEGSICTSLSIRPQTHLLPSPLDILRTLTDAQRLPTRQASTNRSFPREACRRKRAEVRHRILQGRN